MLESHFRIYHGKKMVDYSAFLGSFNPEEENEEFGELVTDEYTAALNANHSGSTKNNTTLNAGESDAASLQLRLLSCAVVIKVAL